MKNTSEGGIRRGSSGAAELMNYRRESYSKSDHHSGAARTSDSITTPIPIGHVQTIVESFGSNVDLYFDVFHIKKDRCTDQQLRIAYFKRGREILADRNRVQSQIDKKSAKQRFQALTMSYEVLSKPEWKLSYDTYRFNGYRIQQRPTFKDCIPRPSIANRDDTYGDNTSRADQSSVGELMSIQSYGSFGSSAPILRRSSSWGTERHMRTRKGPRLRWNENVEELVFKKDPEELRYLKWLNKKYEDSNSRRSDDYDDDDDESSGGDDDNKVFYKTPTHFVTEPLLPPTQTDQVPNENPPQRFVKIKTKSSKSSSRSTSSQSSSIVSGSSSQLSKEAVATLAKELDELDQHFESKTEKSFATDILDEIENGLHGLKKRIGTFIRPTSEKGLSTDEENEKKNNMYNISEDEMQLQIVLSRSSDAATYIPDNSILTVDELTLQAIHNAQPINDKNAMQDASGPTCNSIWDTVITDSHIKGKSNNSTSSMDEKNSKVTSTDGSSSHIDNSYDKDVAEAAKDLDGVGAQTLFMGLLRKPNFKNVTQKSIDKSSSKTSKISKSQARNVVVNQDEKNIIFSDADKPIASPRMAAAPTSIGGILGETTKATTGKLKAIRNKDNGDVDNTRQQQKENNPTGLPFVINAKIKKKNRCDALITNQIGPAEVIDNRFNHDDGDSISALTPGTARFGRQQSAASRVSGRETILDEFDEDDYDNELNKEEDDHVVYTWKGDKGTQRTKNIKNQSCNIDEVSVATTQIEQTMHETGNDLCQGFVRQFMAFDRKASEAGQTSKESKNVKITRGAQESCATATNNDTTNDFVSTLNSYATSIYADAARIGNTINTNLEEARKSLQETIQLSDDEVKNMLDVLGHEMIPPKGSGGEIPVKHKSSKSKRSSSSYEIERVFTI